MLPARARPDAQKKTRHAAEQARADVAAARDAWRKAQPQLTRGRLVFLDETWVKTNMARAHDRSPRGTRLVAAEPHGHWKTTTLIAAIRHDGVVAPYIHGGAINGDVFLAYADSPTPSRCSPRRFAPATSSSMDNLASHKVAGVRTAIETAGATLLYLAGCRSSSA